MSDNLAVGSATVFTVENPLTCDAFFTADDNYRHVVVASTSGEVDEIFFHPQTGVGWVRLLTSANLLDLGGFYTPDDGIPSRDLIDRFRRDI
jgi:hypothetical protein